MGLALNATLVAPPVAVPDESDGMQYPLNCEIVRRPFSFLRQNYLDL